MFNKNSSNDQSTFIQEKPHSLPIEKAPTEISATDSAVEVSSAGFQNGADSAEPVDAKKHTPTKKTIPFTKKPQFKYVLLGTPIVLVLFLFIAVQIKNSQKSLIPEVPVNPAVVNQSPQINRTPLQQRLEKLRVELQQAEPTQQEFSFPPVLKEVALDE